MLAVNPDSSTIGFTDAGIIEDQKLGADGEFAFDVDDEAIFSFGHFPKVRSQPDETSRTCGIVASICLRSTILFLRSRQGHLDVT